ncbi:ABC transporter ATP-binding protein [Halobacteriovorax sp.]|uniref:ABC transporter ATP-binding protein n=1 Tax=Halobacteriovorax sp. TaxID=2020862 RepID=UPI00356A2BA0
MLLINNLSLVINKKEILKNVSLDFSTGGLLTILGPNGSGKSSLIKCISGIYDNWTGEISLNGRSIREYSILERAQIISYVPQLLEVHAEFTVWDFFEMSYYPNLKDLRKLSKEELDRGHDILKNFNLETLKNRSLLSLSGGERQRVFIGASVFQGPKLLLLDEPTSFLDPKVQDDINQIIFSLQEKMDVILISHDINSTLMNSKRIIGLKNGMNFFDGSPENIINKSQLDKLFDKSFKMIKHPSSTLEIIVPEIF